MFGRQCPGSQFAELRRLIDPEGVPGIGNDERPQRAAYCRPGVPTARIDEAVVTDEHGDGMAVSLERRDEAVLAREPASDGISDRCVVEHATSGQRRSARRGTDWRPRSGSAMPTASLWPTSARPRGLDAPAPRSPPGGGWGGGNIGCLVPPGSDHALRTSSARYRALPGSRLRWSVRRSQR